MAEVKKYYWLKLKKDFFKRHDIRIIEEMPNGKEYVLLYLKLLVESISHEGCLRFSDTIPYNEQMISTITNTNIDIVRTAMKLFEQLHMIELLDDETIYMSEVNNLVGTETEWAKKKRIYREKQSLIEDKQKTAKGLEKDIVRQEKEKEIEIDKDIKSIVQSDCTKVVKKAEIDSFFESIWKLYPNKKGKGQVSEAKKKKLYEVGFEQLEIAIQRYKEELKKDDWRKPQNGSTFFNSGYIDYLDGNYQPGEVGQPKAKTNKFNQFPQREYTATQMSDIERKLINKGL